MVLALVYHGNIVTNAGSCGVIPQESGEGDPPPPHTECVPTPAPGDPPPVVTSVAIPYGNLLVVQGDCPTLDEFQLYNAAEAANAELFAVWGQPLGVPPNVFSVWDWPVYMQPDPWALVGGVWVPINGLYVAPDYFVLRCGYESTLQHELRHRILHQIRVVPCWETVGHTSNIDCTPCVGCPPAW
jgi:hypothetical protein